MRPLGIIPSYATEAGDLELLDRCLRSLRASEGYNLDILVVDDHSPLGDWTCEVADDCGAAYHQQEENGGFSRAVNVGLRKARDEGRDAILINADIEMMGKPWLDLMVSQECLGGSGGLASVVGALLLYPLGGMVQHAGIYFSLLTRSFDHLYRYAPPSLKQVRTPTTCPVTGALQFIRHECLVDVGIYDERFRMGMEDVDYCIRAFKSGHECVYQPKVKAWHAESVFRARPSDKLREWQERSLIEFIVKWREQSFAGLVPML